ncbi:MAG: preprotein translocase subunit SecA [Clostridiales bacterium]|jgi:preprotein translocase subunit SecA|nr:preprotein translocase subunit SecA [Clostridiales bacterium]
MGLFKSYSEKEIKRLRPTVAVIEGLRDSMKALSDEELRGKTDEFKVRLMKGETLNDILPEAFAVVREAAVRTLQQEHYNCQLIGGIVLHQGRIAEMRTGEGKTLTSTLPAYLNALTGQGVHVVTVNEYLAKRDAEWMGQIHRFLGLTVGCIYHGLKPEERKEQYLCDITYATNNELGFDYLRDNMVVYEDHMVQRGLNFAIIDEIDSILIDEARTPLIISGPSDKATDMYKIANRFVRGLKKGQVINEDQALNPLLRQEMEEEGDFVVDEKRKVTTLTQEGVIKAERFFAIDNLADPDHADIQHHINNALKANNNYENDKDYVVLEGEIVIVDVFTGRMMPGRRYSDGLHQAIEAKENVEVKKESKTLATITFQNFFNKYTKKCGMTGTALTEEGEFRDIYHMDVVAIPTNMPIMRQDHPDSVYKSAAGKYKAIIEDIKDCHQRGQPVLVGTVSIEKSEFLSNLLKRAGVKHNVLNAKFHEKEAEIVADAGLKGAVTIATNMAGRGTDIKLGEGVVALGGLKIVGTERHESRRIDNQLRGRAGRQGDPGESRFYISAEDDLMRLFGGERMKTIMNALRMPEDEAIDSKALSRVIEGAQKKVEGNHFSARKHLLDYDRIMNEQREIIYGERHKILSGQDLKDHIMTMLKEVVGRGVESFVDQETQIIDINALNKHLEPLVRLKPYTAAQAADKEALKAQIIEDAQALYDKREDEHERTKPEGAPDMRELERIIMLQSVDKRWMDHIDDMDRMRDGVGLQSFGQRDPLTEYRFMSYDMFDELSRNIQYDTIRAMFNLRLATAQSQRRQQVAKIQFTNRDISAVKAPQKRADDKVGRNDPCPCGSGKKYKQCCLTKSA